MHSTAGDRAPTNPAPPQPALPDSRPRLTAISGNPRKQPEPRLSPAPPAVSGQPGRRWAWSAAGIVVAFTGVLFWTGGSRASAGLSVRELDVGDHLRIDWNHSSRVIERGRSGALEIEDGSVRLHEELSQIGRAHV